MCGRGGRTFQIPKYHAYFLSSLNYRGWVVYNEKIFLTDLEGMKPMLYPLKNFLVFQCSGRHHGTRKAGDRACQESQTHYI